MVSSEVVRVKIAPKRDYEANVWISSASSFALMEFGVEPMIILLHGALAGLDPCYIFRSTRIFFGFPRVHPNQRRKFTSWHEFTGIKNQLLLSTTCCLACQIIMSYDLWLSILACFWKGPLSCQQRFVSIRAYN